MKIKAAILGMCAVFGTALSSQATTFNLMFTDFNSVLQGFGSVDGTANLDGSYSLDSGTWNVVAGPEAGLTGSLVLNPNDPGTTYSSSGYFIYDNLLYPAGPAGVDYWGLLFDTGAGPSEMNLFSDSPSQYEEYFNNGVDVYGTLSVQMVASGSVGHHNQNVPDTASSGWMLGSAMLGLGGLGRLARKSS